MIPCLGQKIQAAEEQMHLPDLRPAATAGRASPYRTSVLVVWLLLIAFVTAGSLLPAGSPLLSVIQQLRLSDLALHFFAYVALSVLPVIGFTCRRTGILLGMSMFLLGLLLEACQGLATGRAFELLDLAANCSGVCFGTMLGLPLRMILPLR